MSKVHRAIAVFIVGGMLALILDEFIEKPLNTLEKKVEDSIDG